MSDAEVYKGNKQEIPGDMPPGLWAKKVREYHYDPVTATLPFYHPMMEYLDPRRLGVIRAKARIWYEVTGEPFGEAEFNKSWEVRIARRAAEMPKRADAAVARLTDENVLICGECGARYSPHRDGTHDIVNCNLCGVVMIWQEAVNA